MKASLPLTQAFMAARMIDGGLDGAMLESRAMDAALFNNFRWMAQYAAAGYCNENNAAGALVTCEDTVCADVMAHSTTVYSTMNTDWESTGGAILLDNVNGAIVVSFAGTSSEDVMDLVLDAEVLLEDISLCSGCEVHSGFHAAWDAVSTDVFAKLTTLRTAYPTYSVSFTGHSLGAAVATIGCASWRATGQGCDLYTFGSPRVGNLAFVTFVSAQAGGNYRMTHLDDPIPRLPPNSWGYYHTNVEYWLSDGAATTTSYAASDVTICTGYYSTACNGATSLTLDFTAHSYYLGHISACN